MVEPIEKHRHILVLFDLLCKHKKDVQYIPKNKLYSEIADFFYIDKIMVAKIICKYRKTYSPSRVDFEDFTDKVKRLKEIMEL